MQARVAVYFVLALALFPDASYGRVWDTLAGALRQAGRHVASVTAAGLACVRRRLCSQPRSASLVIFARSGSSSPRTEASRPSRSPTALTRTRLDLDWEVTREHRNHQGMWVKSRKIVGRTDRLGPVVEPEPHRPENAVVPDGPGRTALDRIKKQRLT